MERTNSYNDLKPFRFWCQKVLPLVYDDSLSYYELLDKVIDYLNKTMEDVTVLNDDTEAMYTAYNQLQSYVNNYFDNLDVQDEINAKLDQMAIDGTLSSLINPQIPGAVSAWLAANVDPVGSAVIVDASLTIEGAAADAAAVGRELSQKEDVLAFDDAPTAGSLAPVHSYGIKNYVDGAVDDIEDEITDLKGDLNYKFGFSKLQNVSAYNRANIYGGMILAVTRRWFIASPLPKGANIKTVNIGASQDTAQSRSLIVELWENNNGTLTKVASETQNTQTALNTGNVQEFSFDFNYTAQYEIYVAFLGIRKGTISYSNSLGGTMLASTDVTEATNSLLLSSLVSTNNILPSITIEYDFVAKTNVVTIGNGMDYEEIQDALVDIDDDSESNPYTFIVMPKGTPYKPFSMIRDNWTDTYPWSDISPRNISIIGIDKAHCIIQSNSGNYKFPCGEPMTNGIIKNLTFIMTNSDIASDATQGGYCLHIDCRTLDDVGYKMLIEDCDFECASGPCLGIGIRKNCELTLKRCNFHTTLQQSYAPHEGYTNLYNYGVIFCHTATQADATGQHIIIEDCIGKCEEGSRSLWLSTAGSYDPTTAFFLYTLLRNVFWNVSANAPAYIISDTLTADPMNFGNNIP